MSQLLLSALAVVCPNCDGHNPPRAAACALCGTGLADAPAARPATGPADPRPAAPPPAAPVSRPAPAPVLARAAEAMTPPARASEAVPPGLRPSSSRTPASGLPVEPMPAAAALRGAPPRAAPTVPHPSAPPVARPAGVPPPPPGSPAPKAAPSAPPAARPLPAASRFGLAVIAGTARGQRYKLPVTGCVIGRTRGAILFGDDIFVSAVHATFVVKEGALFVRDESSASGVYVTIPGAEHIGPRTLFSAGQRLFRFNGRIDVPTVVPGRPTVYGAPMPLGQAVYGVEEMLVGGRGGRLVVTAAQLLTIGQAHCDLAYPNDEGLAGRHCELSPSSTGAILRDLSGGLGTYVRIAPATERPLRPGDRVRVGQHVLQVEALA